MTMINVQGECPMGCGPRLHLNPGTGMIICINKTCPRPTAVSDLLKHPPVHHKVEVDFSGFAIKHPLFERIEDKLFECDLQRYLADCDGPPASAGVYRVRTVPEEPVTAPGLTMVDGWLWEKIEEEL